MISFQLYELQKACGSSVLPLWAPRCPGISGWNPPIYRIKTTESLLVHYGHFRHYDNWRDVILIHVYMAAIILFIWASLVAQTVKHLPGFNPWFRTTPWRRKWQPTPGFLPGEFHGQRSLVGCSPWGHKESDTTEWLTHTHILFIGGFLGGSVVKHSPVKAGGSSSIPELGKSPGEGNGSPLQYSCLQIPWTEEPGKLQSKRLQKSWTQLSD